MIKGLHPFEGLLVLLIAVGIGLHLFAEPDYGKRNLEFMHNMGENPGFESQDVNPLFDDGRTLRRPVEGTVARGFLPMHQGDGLLNIDESRPAGEWVKLPPEEQARWNAYKPSWNFDELTEAAQAAHLTRGRQVWMNVCATCHGQFGAANTPVSRRGMRPPPVLTDPALIKMSDGQMYRVITVGKGDMASHANQVTRDDRWKVIRYIRTLQKPKQ